MKGLCFIPPRVVHPRLSPAQVQLHDAERYEIRAAPPRKPRDRTLLQINHHSLGGVFTSFADNKANATTAITERVFCHEVVVQRTGGQRFTILCRPNTPAVGHIRLVMSPATRQLRRYIWPSTPIEIRAYPGLTYRGRRLKLYTAAAEKAATMEIKRRVSYLSTFLKHEKLPYVPGKRTVPRVIQPRSPVYNVLVGRYLHHLEGVVYMKLAQLLGGPTVMKGFNVEQVGCYFNQAWNSFKDPIAVGLDAHRFDQHVRSEMLRWEHSIYRMFYPCDAQLAQLLEWQCKNRGFLRVEDVVIEYEVDGGRCSGDMNTAMGNCLIMCASLYIYLRCRNRTSIRVLNNGDDVVLIGERTQVMSVLPGIAPFFVELGFVMKIEQPVEVFEEIEFCQTHPIMRDTTDALMCRNFPTSVAKDLTILRTLTGSDLRSHLAAIAQCGLSLTDGVPVLAEFYNSLLRMSEGADASRVGERFYDDGFYRLSRGLTYRGRAVSDCARVSFYRAFGVTPDLQMQLEDVYAQPSVLVDQQQGGIPVPICPYARGWFLDPSSEDRLH